MIVSNCPSHALRQLKKPHHEFVDFVLRELDACKFYTGKIKCFVTGRDNVFAAAIETFPQDVRLAEGQSMWLGLVNSTDTRHTPSMWGCFHDGGAPIVCEKYPLTKPRGNNWNGGMPSGVPEKIDLFVMQCGTFLNAAREMKHRWMSARDQDTALIDACRDLVLSWRFLGHANKAVYGDGDRDMTVWHFYRSVASVIAEKHYAISNHPAISVFDRLYRLRNILTREDRHARYTHRDRAV